MSNSKLYFKLRTFYIKTTSWEYWPMWIVYFPVSFYYIYLSIKARSFFFFSASNPTIETGGMFFESKWKIFELIPQQYFPTTIYINENESLKTVINKISKAKILYPIIAPDFLTFATTKTPVVGRYISNKTQCVRGAVRPAAVLY